MDYQTHVDTRQQTPASIGADMWAGAGDQAIDEAIKTHGSAEAAAQAVANLFEETGAEWINYDDEPLDVKTYVLAYIT